MCSFVQPFRGGFKLMIRRNTFVAEEHIEVAGSLLTIPKKGK